MPLELADDDREHRQAVSTDVEQKAKQSRAAAAGPRSSSASHLPDEEGILQGARHEQLRGHPHCHCGGIELACLPSFSTAI